VPNTTKRARRRRVGFPTLLTHHPLLSTPCLPPLPLLFSCSGLRIEIGLGIHRSRVPHLPIIPLQHVSSPIDLAPSLRSHFEGAPKAIEVPRDTSGTNGSIPTLAAQLDGKSPRNGLPILMVVAQCGLFLRFFALSACQFPPVPWRPVDPVVCRSPRVRDLRFVYCFYSRRARLSSLDCDRRRQRR
jgi:hypothetical protein